LRNDEDLGSSCTAGIEITSYTYVVKAFLVIEKLTSLLKRKVVE
jgi:hypothetical protein